MRVLWPAIVLVPALIALPGRGRTLPRPLPIGRGDIERSDTTLDSDRTQLVSITQQLLDGVATADTALWDRMLTEDCLMMDPDGVTRNKKELLAMMHPLPSGYSGTLKVEHPQVRIHGAAAVLSYDATQYEEVYGQPTLTYYHTMDTYVRTVVGWRLLGSQSLIVPREPDAITVDSMVLQSYVGRYSLAPTVVYDVIREGDHLYGQWPGGAKEEMIPSGPATFFRHGVRGDRYFERDSAGRVTSMVDRRDNNDLVWKRVM
jgi:Domain of unknown function (DUF4440)/Domain of unknown function (DUF3471)